MTKEYFNFTATAVAYINEVRIITPKRGDKFCAIKAIVLEGNTEDPDKIPIDLIVRGSEAKSLIWNHKDQWPSYGGHKWFATLRIGSLNTKPYLDKKGEPSAVLSGRLLAISYLSIDGEEVYKVSSEAVDAVA